MIQVEEITRNYGDFVAVDGVSFEISRGEIVGFLGHNGAGKTTVMKMLTGFLEPTAGTIRVDGLDIEESRSEVQEKIGYLPENCPVYPEMTVIDYLEFAAELHGVPQSSRLESVRKAIDDTELAAKAAQPINTLSRGYRQRVGVAQAILHAPQILILDEPTSGLDPSQIRHMRGLIKRLAETSTVILSTHILQEVQAICDRVIIINKGKIVAVDTPENLTGQLAGGETIELEIGGSVDNIVALLEEIPDVKSVSVGEPRKDHSPVLVETEGAKTVRHLIAQKVIGSGLELYQLRTRSISLEEVFVQLTTEEEEKEEAVEGKVE
ncbi:MAG: ABC transporter ATP-binding protein [Acidobacteria bacterium]|nr:ABC transporter ATP-binding protein [Acidobacteriota bacterium]